MSDLHRKIPLGMTATERATACQLLIDVSNAALKTFDVIESDRISPHDTEVMLSMTRLHNQFVKIMSDHANKRLREAGIR